MASTSGLVIEIPVAQVVYQDSWKVVRLIWFPIDWSPIDWLPIDCLLIDCLLIVFLHRLSITELSRLSCARSSLRLSQATAWLSTLRRTTPLTMWKQRSVQLWARSSCSLLTSCCWKVTNSWKVAAHLGTTTSRMRPCSSGSLQLRRLSFKFHGGLFVRLV